VGLGRYCHIFFGKNRAITPLFTVASGHLVAHRQLFLHVDVDLDQLYHAGRQFVALTQLADFLVGALSARLSARRHLFDFRRSARSSAAPCSQRILPLMSRELLFSISSRVRSVAFGKQGACSSFRRVRSASNRWPSSRVARRVWPRSSGQDADFHPARLRAGSGSAVPQST